jgi:peroxiredoxin
MKHFSRRTFLATGALAAPAARAWATPTIPRPAPEFSVTLNSGEQVNLGQFKGKVLALEMLLTTCPHCQRCSRTVQKVYSELSSQGFAALGAAVNDGARQGLLQFMMTTGAQYPMGVADRDKAYELLQADINAGPVYFPQLIFIDRKGMIRAQYGGTDNFFLDEEKNVREMVEKLLKDPGLHTDAKGAKK